MTTEQWEAYGDPESDGHAAAVSVIQAFAPQAQIQYTAQKTEFDGLRATQVKEADARNLAFSDSMKGSADHLAESLPDVNQGYVDSLSEDFRSGALQSFFYETDGTVKKEALLNYAMVKDGFALYQSMEKMATNKAETVERQEILLRGAETPIPIRGKAGFPEAERSPGGRHRSTRGDTRAPSLLEVRW